MNAGFRLSTWVPRMRVGTDQGDPYCRLLPAPVPMSSPPVPMVIAFLIKD